jgi:hypothetical protein
MTEQPEALRLADALDELDRQFSRNGLCGDAAAELRWLHAKLTESEKWRDRDEARAANAERERDIAEAQRDALLGVLRTIKDTKRLARDMQQQWCPAAQGMVRMASAAIKAVEEKA